MARRLPAAALLAAALAAAGVPAPAPAETVCRPTALGATGCPNPGPRPMPRPPGRTVQGLDRARATAPRVTTGTPGFVPSRQTNRLGGATITDRDVGTGRCRPDTLGNLNCR